jgi:hypothetical protein
MRRFGRVGLGAMALAALLVVQVIHPAVAPAAPAGTRTLQVGPHARYTSIQAAVNAASAGDWILISPGDYHEHGAPNAGVLITTPNLHLRGLDRNRVIVDGTKLMPSVTQPCSANPTVQDFGPPDGSGNPTGRNGIEVFKADGVTIENLTVCNFLGSASGHNGNQIWWNGGDGSGKIGLGSLRGEYLTASSTYFKDANSAMAQYGIFTSNEGGPGRLAHTYASNMGDSSYYVGACPDCRVVVTDAHAQNSALGYSGSNAGGHLIIENSQWDHNRAGVAPNSLNNDDAPPPQNGACPLEPQKSCTIIRSNLVHDNNNPNTPASGLAGGSPVGAGIELSGSQNDTVRDNTVWNQGGWGIVINDYPDSETPPPVAHCQGGIQSPGLCYFLAFGNRIEHNHLSDNGFFGNPSNGDLADVTLAPLPGEPGNCFVGNHDREGPLTSDPAAIQTALGTCGQSNAGGDVAVAGLQLLCATGTVPQPCGGTYPQTTTVQMLPIPRDLPSMPDPCDNVPDTNRGPCK